MNSLKRLLAVMLVCAITALPALADEPLPAERKSMDMGIDMMIARPLGLLSVIGGSALFVLSLPFTIPSGSMDSAADELVKKPIDYTFKRPLGELGSGRK
jgi:hypothetical protein